MEHLRERGGADLHVGITLNLTNAIADNPRDPADVDAARRIDGLWNRMFLEPLILGAYPADVLEDLASYDFEQWVHDGDLETIAQPLDFLGVNHYHDDNFRAHPLPPDTVGTRGPPRGGPGPSSSGPSF